MRSSSTARQASVLSPPILLMAISIFWRVEGAPTPDQLLVNLPDGDTWTSLTRRSIARLRAFFLLAEDPQRRLDARQVKTLAHQVSLVSWTRLR
jgi:hypothetical protein